MRFAVFALYYPVSSPVDGELMPRHRATLAAAPAAKASAFSPKTPRQAGNGHAGPAFPSLHRSRAKFQREWDDEEASRDVPELLEQGRRSTGQPRRFNGGHPPDATGRSVPSTAGDAVASEQALLDSPDEDAAVDPDDGAYEFLGPLAPEVIHMQARSGEGGFMAMESGRAGLYRPNDFRAAPWSGLAYDTAPADGRGLHAGSRILTLRGEVPVEDLRPSDQVLGLRGPRVAGIAWIGRCTAGSVRSDLAPVRIRANALGASLPSRDVLIGPNQVVFPDGSLPMTARDLVRQGLAEQAQDLSAELFQVALKPYAGAEDGDVILVDGIFAASRLPPEG